MRQASGRGTRHYSELADREEKSDKARMVERLKQLKLQREEAANKPAAPIYGERETDCEAQSGQSAAQSSSAFETTDTLTQRHERLIGTSA